MKILSNLIQNLHLDPRQLLLTARGVQTVQYMFGLLDVEDNGFWDDVTFMAFMLKGTNLREKEVNRIFDVFDVERTGQIGFDQFYLIICILVAIDDNQQKEFLWNHSRTCFELIDIDGTSSVSREEFRTFGFVFNISNNIAKDIFTTFDLNSNDELDYEEFRMFTMACLDRQRELDNS